ncbi:MAG: ferritin-like domain-containing protein [Acidimicrobiales bacterium]|nr:ferritin-like domain-containing protein [Acidimicrobiales bacterium]MBO0894168.1 ferritin-like domain-containing protein [Acidimicrobiales bacterium]
MSGTTNRRTVLLGALGAAGGLALSACTGQSNQEPIPTTTTPVSIPNGTATTAEQVAALGASLENLAVYAYDQGLKATQQAKGTGLAPAPPSLSVLAQTAKNHHAQHAARWNQILTSANLQAVNNTDPVVTPAVNAMLAGLSEPIGLAELALYVENTLAQTYQALIGRVRPNPATQTAAAMQPVEMQHAAFLYLALGRYPGLQGSASNRFANGETLALSPVDLSRPLSDYQGT